ncbi:exported protein of unknown function [Acidithiobacillus ferrivorans]|jgi:hypothetical protein|uniref:Lipoprotein n=1 Tax=Acidithiobacillus ferrivorans TaxID=160808 RepID=A0A060ULY2_9PROT|nr:exported hypothetical protein [Acidithiobacillus ferrivorans]SMH65285.1 exported protein of unknown function [Acidithiobacillus ferrivorans]
MMFISRLGFFLCCSWLLTACATEVSSHPAALPNYPVHVSAHGWYSITVPVPINKATAAVKRSIRQLSMRYGAHMAELSKMRCHPNGDKTLLSQ